MAPSNTSQAVPDSIKQKYSDILKANGIIDKIKRVTAHEPEELKGAHMATEVVYVLVEFEDPSKKPKNLFVKNHGHIEGMKNMRLMEKETSFFNDFLPFAREFCRKYPPGCSDVLDCFPKCLHADEETVVLENVVLDHGYVMLPKDELQDLETAKLVLANLAKFHAVSAAIIEERGPETFIKEHELLAFDTIIVEGGVIGPFLDSGIDTCLNILRENNGNPKSIEVLSRLERKGFEIVKSIIPSNPKDKLMRVLNHGDFHTNNMLFKMDPETGKAIQHLFIDLQCTRVGSPTLDIAYYLYTSVVTAVRRNHLEELLRHYFDAFVTTLEALGKKCPVTFEEFFEDYQKRFILGYLINLNTICGTDSFKDVDRSNVSPDDPNALAEMFNNAVNSWMKNNPDKAIKVLNDIDAIVEEYLKLTSSQ